MKPKRFAYPWQRMAVRAALVLVILVGLWQVSAFVVRATVPMINASRQAAELATLLASAQDYLEGGDWDNAERLYRQVLERPDLPPEARTQAEAALAQIGEERELDKLYHEIVAIQESGDCTTALQRFGELLVRRSNYKDVNERVQTCCAHAQGGRAVPGGPDARQPGPARLGARLLSADPCAGRQLSSVTS